MVGHGQPFRVRIMWMIGAPSRLATRVRPVTYQSSVNAKTSRLNATSTAKVKLAWRRRFSARSPPGLVAGRGSQPTSFSRRASFRACRSASAARFRATTAAAASRSARRFWRSLLMVRRFEEFHRPAGATGPWRAKFHRPGVSFVGRPVKLSRRSQRLHPVAQEPGAGVAGLLGVELRGPQRPVLDRGHEPVATVLAPGDQWRAGAAVGLELPAADAVGVDEVEPLALDAGEHRRTLGHVHG